MSNFLRLPRTVFSSPYWTASRKFSEAEALIDIIRSANFSDKDTFVNGKRILVPTRGWAASERFLESRWSWSRTKIRKFIGDLEKDKILTKTKNHGETVLIVSESWCYERGGDGKEPAKNQQRTTKETTKKPPGGQKKNHPESGCIPDAHLDFVDCSDEKEPPKNHRANGEKTGRSAEKEPNPQNLPRTIREPTTTPLPPQGGSSPLGKQRSRTVTKKPARARNDYTPEFEAFWKIYPNPSSKWKAFEAWETNRHLIPPLENLKPILEAWKVDRRWMEEGGKYIPHGATWINKRRWEDGLPNTTTKNDGDKYKRQF